MPTVTINAEEIFYVRHGDGMGAPLVFVHGAGNTHAVWAKQLEALQNCTAYALDLPGHGQSSGAGRDDVANYADVVHGFLDQLLLSSAVLVGHSLGGAIALSLAIHKAARVRGLVLVSSGARLRVHPNILRAVREGRPVTRGVLGEEPPAERPAPGERASNNVTYGDWLACDRFDVMDRAHEVVCPTWGFIALLDTVSGTTALSATLAALGPDGLTALQTDTGSWERGSGIALQSYADGSTHYLRVKAADVTSYTLRYYQTIVDSQPEAEPNNTRATGTPSSFTHAGIVSPTGDVDCFAFDGRAGDGIVLAVNADGSSLDPVLELVDPSDVVLKSADQSGAGGKEFIEYTTAVPGAYAYCVRDKAGGGGAGYTYRAGIVRHERLYYPEYNYSGTWLNPGPENFARPGDLLTFHFAVTNTGPVTVPGQLNFSASFNDACLAVVSSSPPAPVTTNSVSWYGQKTDLVPGEVYSVSMTMRALARCNEFINGQLNVPYYLSGHGIQIPYQIFESIYLPLVTR